MIRIEWGDCFRVIYFCTYIHWCKFGCRSWSRIVARSRETSRCPPIGNPYLGQRKCPTSPCTLCRPEETESKFMVLVHERLPTECFASIICSMLAPIFDNFGSNFNLICIIGHGVQRVAFLNIRCDQAHVEGAGYTCPRRNVKILRLIFPIEDWHKLIEGAHPLYK